VRPFLFPPSIATRFAHYRFSLCAKESAFRKLRGQMARLSMPMTKDAKLQDEGEGFDSIVA
jgi:hypothetical protein